jgi:hypothetical protein
MEHPGIDIYPGTLFFINLCFARFVKTNYHFIRRREIKTENKFLINFANNSTWKSHHFVGKVVLKKVVDLSQADSKNPVRI